MVEGMRPPDHRAKVMMPSVSAIRARKRIRCFMSSNQLNARRDVRVRALMRQVLFFIAAASLAFAQKADLAVTNARVYTVNGKQPRAIAIAVRNGLIAAVGEDVSGLIGPSTRVV